MGVQLAEGETKRTQLPLDCELVQTKRFGVHTLAVEKFGIEKSKVELLKYPSWQSAFEAVMDKAGM